MFTHTEQTKIENGVIVLPKNVRKSWQNADVVTRITADTVLIKRVQPSSFWKTWRRLGKAGRGLTSKDIERAVRSDRSKTIRNA